MPNTAALKPEFFSTLPTIIKDKQAEKLGVTTEELQLHALSTSAGWKVLEQYIKDVLEDLDNITDQSMAQGLSLEDIGRNALVANLSKGLIKKIMAKVTDAREAVEKPDGTAT